MLRSVPVHNDRHSYFTALDLPYSDKRLRISLRFYKQVDIWRKIEKSRFFLKQQFQGSREFSYKTNITDGTNLMLVRVYRMVSALLGSRSFLGLTPVMLRIVYCVMESKLYCCVALGNIISLYYSSTNLYSLWYQSPYMLFFTLFSLYFCYQLV